MAACRWNMRGFFKLFHSFIDCKTRSLLPKHQNRLLVHSFRYRSEDSGSSSQGKELNLVVSSLRVDRIAASGFAIGRRKMDLMLIAGKLYLNKNVVMKSSAKVKCKDILELVTKQTANVEDSCGKQCLSRLEITDVSDTLTKKGNLRITLIRQRNIFMDRKHFDQFYKKKKYD